VPRDPQGVETFDTKFTAAEIDDSHNVSLPISILSFAPRHDRRWKMDDELSHITETLCFLLHLEQHGKYVLVLIIESLERFPVNIFAG
jgi:hypothetical protein